MSVIIPAYNEGKTIHLVLDKVKAVHLIDNIQKEIIIVNDCSTDDTEGSIRDYISANPSQAIQCFRHDRNLGKGAALHTGIAKATGEYIVIQDADLEYDPQEFNDLLKPVVDGHADVVYGSRYKGSHAHRILFYWHRKCNKMITALSNVFTNMSLTDVETCYKLFDAKLIKSLDLKEKRFGFDPEVTAKISRIPGIRIYEIGISYYARTFQEGKKISMKDAFRAVYCILKYNLFP